MLTHLTHQQPPIDIGSSIQEVNVKLDLEVDMFSSGCKVCQFSEHSSSPGTTFCGLVEVFINIASARMSDSQKLVLCTSYDVLKHNNMTLTALADVISRRTGVPYSTVKWNLRSLVDLGLLVGGDANNRGEPACFTESGLMLVEHLRSE